MSTAQQTGNVTRGNGDDQGKYTENPNYNPKIREDKPEGEIEIIGLEDDNFEDPQEKKYEEEVIKLGGNADEWSHVIRELENQEDKEPGTVPESVEQNNEEYVKRYNSDHSITGYIRDKLSIL
jgi:hypothetical protein